MNMAFLRLDETLDILNYKSLIIRARNAVREFREFATALKIDKQLIGNIAFDFFKV